MMRDADQQKASGFECLSDFSQNPLVVVDMLDDVEHAGDVELVFERQPPRIELNEFGPRSYASLGDLQTFHMNFGSDQRNVGARILQRFEHKAGSATDLKHRLRLGKEPV